MLAVGSLALAAPSAAPDPGGGAKAGGHVAPGQAKKALATGAIAPVTQAQPAGEPQTAAAAGAGAAKKQKQPARTSGGSTAAKRAGASKPPSSSSKAAAKSPAASASDGSDGSTGGGRSASAARAAQPAPTPATAPVSAPAPAAVAAAPPAVAAPPPAATTAPAPATRATARPTTLSDTPAARRLAQARSTPRRPVTPLAAVAGAPAGAAPAPAATDVLSGAGDGDAARDGEGPASPLTRTVVRVLEVIPPGVQMTLAALALIGLLLGIATVVQTGRGRRLAHQRKLLLADVGILQSALLPDLPARIGGARVTAAYLPAAGLAAGGDFYDAFELPGGRTAVIVGDVAGHGRDAVPLTALVRYNLRAYLEAGLAPRATLDVASHVLAPQLGGRQVTIVVAIFDPGTGRLTYACAGHWPPLLLGTSGEIVTACSSPPIGTGMPTGRRQTTVALPPGASACFHTDGLEAPIGDRRRLGREELAAELAAIGPRGDAQDLVERVVRRSESQPDDMAACIITALPGGAEHWSLRIEELEVDAAALRGGWGETFLLACGVGRSHIQKALNQARAIVGQSGTAVVEVRIGEQLVEVRVAPPAAVSLPIAARPLELAKTA